MCEVDQLRADVLTVISQCIIDLNETNNAAENAITQLQSAVSAICALSEYSDIWWRNTAIRSLEAAIDILIEHVDVTAPICLGRPSIDISISQLEYFLSMNFKISDIARMLGISRTTISRRLKENGLSVSQMYTAISEEELQNIVHDILMSQPTTGYKRMKGHLLHRGIKVTDQRVREIMRIADPSGVYQRTVQRNRCIRRRQYYVQFSNQMWHIDGNLKLIRWGFVIRCGIDGKSRTITYLEATDNNRADTHLKSFLSGVEKFGIPLRTRSDKGGENVLIARYMIEHRGVGRSSHICGRSVHNQRIERFWRDLSYGCTNMFYNMFTVMEENGILNVDNQRQMQLLHYVFLPRLNKQLSSFLDGWNHHPLSTEGNYTPLQLMFINLPPPDYDLLPSQEGLPMEDIPCEHLEDLQLFNPDAGDTLTNPGRINDVLTEEEQAELIHINVLRDSNNFGYDIFLDAIRCLR